VTAPQDSIVLVVSRESDGPTVPAVAVAITVIGLYGLRRVSSRHPAVVGAARHPPGQDRDPRA
jgi:hypothetical protein